MRGEAQDYHLFVPPHASENVLRGLLSHRISSGTAENSGSGHIPVTSPADVLRSSTPLPLRFEPERIGRKAAKHLLGTVIRRGGSDVCEETPLRASPAVSVKMGLLLSEALTSVARRAGHP